MVHCSLFGAPPACCRFLAHNRLQGSLPSDLPTLLTTTLPALERLDLSQNALTGTLPANCITTHSSEIYNQLRYL